MKQIGRIPDEQAGHLLMQTLEADTLKKRQSWYAEELPSFVESNLITEEQAEAAKRFIGLPVEDILHLDTPYDLAEKQGVLTHAQAEAMNRRIFERAHSGTALCSGTAAIHCRTGTETMEDVTLSSDRRDENVVKVSGGASLRLKHAVIEKSGDTTDHSEGSMTGLNAAVLAEGGRICIEDSEVVSRAIGGNNVFVHGADSHVTLKNVLLDACGSASNRCVYVSFGGTLEAEDCEFTSRGTISSTVATDTGGGEIRLRNCLVKALGNHCAGLYSTGTIAAEHCICVAPETEGMIIVGGNSITLKDSYVFSGQGQGIKLTSALETCAGTFSMTGGSLTACEGPVVLAEGDAEILLENVSVANPSGEAVRGVFAPAPPEMGQHPDAVHRIRVQLRRQMLSGKIACDASHEVSVDLEDGSVFRGSINPDGAAHAAVLRLSRDSVWELTGDSVLDAAENEDPSGNNIVLNGHSLQIREKKA